MTSSRDCDVTSREQNSKNYFMTHGKRLSINQYRADLSTVFHLDFISCRRGMGISVSVYLLLLLLLLSIIYIVLKKKWKSRFLTYHISGTAWPRNLKFFLWSRVDLKFFQKNFQVSTISGTWLTRGLKMAKLVILLHLYITIAGKSDFLKFLILLLCCLYCVVVLFSMFLLGPRCLYPVLTLSRTN